MSQTRCLNCEQEILGAYCHRCGQKASIHRLSLKHFLQHDLIHGLWHLDKGIFYTLRLIITRPGQAASAYIAGRRAGHFSVVTLLALLTGIFLYLLSLMHIRIPRIQVEHQDAADLLQFFERNGKWLLLVIVPLSAKASLDLFRRLRYNYTEHMMMNAFFMTGMLCIALAFLGLYLVPFLSDLLLLVLETIAILAYLFYCYRGAAGGVYSGWGLAWRFSLYLLALLSYILGFLFAILVIYVLLR